MPGHKPLKSVNFAMKKFALLFAVCFVFLGAQAFSQVTPRAEYYDNGKKKYQGNTDGDKKVGEWVYYHDNGLKAKEGLYQDGNMTGLWKEYWSNGGVKTEINFRILNGKSVKHGDYITYHKNGAKEIQGQYNRGQKVGMWYEYNKLGIQLNKKQY